MGARRSKGPLEHRLEGLGLLRKAEVEYGQLSAEYVLEQLEVRRILGAVKAYEEGQAKSDREFIGLLDQVIDGIQRRMPPGAVKIVCIPPTSFCKVTIAQSSPPEAKWPKD